MSKVLKLVRGSSYSCPAAYGDRVLRVNETVEVSDEHAEMLLEETMLDKSNNVHHYFVEVGEGDGADVDADADADAAPSSGGGKKPARSRSRAGTGK